MSKPIDFKSKIAVLNSNKCNFKYADIFILIFYNLYSIINLLCDEVP